MSGFGENHLSAEEIAAYVDGDVSLPQRERIEAHLARCETCLDEVAAVEDLVRRGPAAHGSRRWRWPAVAASAAAAAVLLVFLLPPQADRAVDGLRSPDPAVPTPLPTLEVYAPPEEVERGGDILLRWEAAGEGALYRVSVLDSVGTTLWSEETRETGTRLPEDVRQDLEPGARYFWRADGLMSDLRTLSTGVRSFRIRP